jgi:hypothetical protein
MLVAKQGRRHKEQGARDLLERLQQAQCTSKLIAIPPLLISLSTTRLAGFIFAPPLTLLHAAPENSSLASLTRRAHADRALRTRRDFSPVRFAVLGRARPCRRSPEPPRARALLSLNAAPCALLRPPSAPGCRSHRVRTASS